MRSIKIILVSEDKFGFWESNNPDGVRSAQEVGLNFGNNRIFEEPKTTRLDSNFQGLGEIWSNQTADNQFAPLKQVLSNQPEDNIPGQIELPKFDSSAAERILRYAAPNLGNDDYYPEKTVSPIIGSASNKTLGTFPLFSNAALAPAGLWDKRRRAIGDYMLQLEQSKSQKDAGLNYEFTPQEGSSRWMKAYNDVAIEDLAETESEASRLGISLKDAGKLGHPANNKINSVVSNLKSGLKTVTDIEKTIADISSKNLNLDNRIGARATEAMMFYDNLSSLPDDAPIEFGGVKYQGKKELIRSKGFQDAMYELAADLKIDNDLLSVAANRAKQIEENILKEYEKSGSGENYIEFKQKRLESKYPLYGKKNPLTGEPEESTETYLDTLAGQIMQSRPGMFKETSKDKEAAEYTKDDIKNILRSNLGYSYEETPMIASGLSRWGGGGSSAKETVNAAPEYIKTVLKKLDKNEVVQGKSGKSVIVSGDKYTTYIINGQTRVVPNSNIVENAKAAAEAGAADGEYGAVDYPTAIVQMETSKDAETMYGEFKKSRKYATDIYNPDADKTVQDRFNNSIKAISGDRGVPVAGSQNVWISGMQSKSDDKSDASFYFKVRDKDSKTDTKGVVIPKDMVEYSVDDPNAGFWSKLLGNDKVKLFGSKDSNVSIVSGAYYKKSEVGGVSYYTVYDQSTNSPLQFPKAGKARGTYEIRVPAYFVENIINEPEKLVKDANASYEQGIESPSSVKMTSTSETKTKTGGQGTVMTVDKKSLSGLSDESLRIIRALINAGRNQNEAMQLESSYRLGTSAATKDMYAKLKQQSSNIDISDLKK